MAVLLVSWRKSAVAFCMSQLPMQLFSILLLSCPTSAGDSYAYSNEWHQTSVLLGVFRDLGRTDTIHFRMVLTQRKLFS